MHRRRFSRYCHWKQSIGKASVLATWQCRLVSTRCLIRLCAQVFDGHFTQLAEYEFPPTGTFPYHHEFMGCFRVLKSCLCVGQARLILC
jgi:hypothetical protein